MVTRWLPLVFIIISVNLFAVQQIYMVVSWVWMPVSLGDHWRFTSSASCPARSVIIYVSSSRKGTAQNWSCHLFFAISRQLSDIICQLGQLSARTTVSSDICQPGQLSDRTTVRWATVRLNCQSFSGRWTTVRPDSFEADSCQSWQFARHNLCITKVRCLPDSIYLYWIFAANIWGIYVTRRDSVRPSGAW